METMATTVKSEMKIESLTPPPPKTAPRKKAKRVVPKIEYDFEEGKPGIPIAAVPETPVKRKVSAGSKRKEVQELKAPETPPVVEAPGLSRAHSAAEVVKLRSRGSRTAFEE